MVTVYYSHSSQANQTCRKVITLTLFSYRLYLADPREHSTVKGSSGGEDEDFLPRKTGPEDQTAADEEGVLIEKRDLIDDLNKSLLVHDKSAPQEA